MQQYREGQRLKGSDGNIYVVQGGVPRPVGGQPNVVVPVAADPRQPYQLAQEQAQAQAAPYSVPKAQADAQIAQANASVAPSVAQAEAVKAQAQAALAQAQLQQEQAKAKGKPVDSARAELARIIQQIDAIEADATDNGGWFETGYTGSMNRERPGTAAYDLAKAISTIDANSAFSKLAQMRSESPTGAALGSVTEKELELLKSTVANLDPNQSQGSFLNNLRIAREHYSGLLGRIGGQDPRQQQQAQAAPLGAFAPATGETRTEIKKGPLEKRIEAMLRGGASDETIRAAAIPAGFPRDQLEGVLAWRKANPSYKGAYDVSEKVVTPLNAFERGINAVGQGPAGAFAVSTANALTGGFLDELSANPERAQMTKELLRQQEPGWSLGGDIAGTALGMTGLNAGLRFAGGRLAPLATKWGGIGGDALYGAAYGAGENNDSRLTGAAAGAASAGLGNVAGRALVGGVGRVSRGVQDANVGYLDRLGVPMTPGQVIGQGGGMFGRAARGIEDKLTSVPVLGDAISARRGEGINAFNREAFREALEPIGVEAQNRVGSEAIEQAQDAVSGAYGNALNGVSLRADLPFIQQAAPAIRAGREVPTGPGEQFDYMLRRQVAPLFDANRSLDGQGFQSALSNMNAGASGLSKQGIMGQEAAGAMRDLRGAFTDMAERQAPEVMPQLNAANQSYRNVSVLEDANLAALNSQQGAGIFTPAQLGAAMKQNSRKFGGKKAAARGDMPFAQLQEAGQAVLPSTVPNSGTVDRGWASLVLPGALGGAAYGADQLEAPAPLVGGLAGLAALTSRPGAAAFQRAAVRRPDSMIQFGNDMLTTKALRRAGMFGGSLLLPVVGP